MRGCIDALLPAPYVAGSHPKKHDRLTSQLREPGPRRSLGAFLDRSFSTRREFVVRAGGAWRPACHSALEKSAMRWGRPRMNARLLVGSVGWRQWSSAAVVLLGLSTASISAAAQGTNSGSITG